MGWRGTLVLALLIVVVGVLLWREGAPPEGRDTGGFGDAPPREPTEVPAPLLTFKPLEIVAVRLERRGEVREAQRTDDGWTAINAGATVDDFLSDLAKLGVLMEIPAGRADLQEYGLAPPQGVLQLRLRGIEAPLILQIGDRNPATTGVYVRRGTDGDVALAGALVGWDFDKTFEALGAH